MLNTVLVHPAQPPPTEPLFLLPRRLLRIPSFHDGAEARVAIVRRRARKPAAVRRGWGDSTRGRWGGGAYPGVWGRLQCLVPQWHRGHDLRIGVPLQTGQLILVCGNKY
jgi:hypothetical protein